MSLEGIARRIIAGEVLGLDKYDVLDAEGKVEVEALVVAKLGMAKAAALLSRVALPPKPAAKKPHPSPPKPPATKPQPPKPAELPAAPKPACSITQTLVEIDPSPWCTRKCEFCAPGIPQERRKQEFALTVEQHNEVIDQLAAANYGHAGQYVCYCGHGEPTMAPDVLEMLQYARAALPPETKLVLYTNGDKLSAWLLCGLEALDLDLLVWDCYDDASARHVPKAIAHSSFDPGRVRVNDYRAGMPQASSRCGSVCTPDREHMEGPCVMPRDKLFVTDDGKGGCGWLLCCEDYKRESLRKGTLAEQTAWVAPLADALALQLSAAGLPAICSKCDRKCQGQVRFDHTPKLVDSPFWPWNETPKAPEGRRLVVVACNGEWGEHAALLLDAVDRLSIMPGESLVVWNDAQSRPPAALNAPGRMIWDFEGALGWQGISRGLGQAYRYAADCGYDWVIKLDTDSCLLRRGWDAVLCVQCPSHAQAGTVMDIARQGVIPNDPKHPGGLYTRQLERIRWARGLVRQKRRRWSHVQGGCYVVGLEALRRIDKMVGLACPSQDPLPEQHDMEGRSRVGEDVLFDSKCKVAGVYQCNVTAVSSWWISGSSRDKAPTDAQMEHLRILRDNEGCAVAHPIKHLPTMRTLVEEATNA